MKNFLKGKTIQLMTGMIIASIAFISACGDDDDETPVEPLLGRWEISSATIAEDIAVTNTIGEELLLPTGTDITPIIAGSFLANINCNDQNAKAIELAEGNDILYVCTQEDKSSEAGSWFVESDRSGLRLNISIEETPVPLNLVNLQETSTTMSGLVNSIPLPPSLLALADPRFGLVTTAAIPVSLNMGFRKL
ncbi:MAG: hypothetical protein AAGC88_15705 [Bacteroidota bacterium]